MEMKWHLLNQHFVSLEPTNSVISVLEELVSSEQQLVLLLVSGMVSPRTMTSALAQAFYNQLVPIELQEVI